MNFEPIIFVLQVDRVSAKRISTNSLSCFYQTIVGSDRCHGLCFKTKAKLSVEGNVVEKESTSVNEKIGNSSC